MELLCLILFQLLPGQLNYLSQIWQNDEYFFFTKKTQKGIALFRLWCRGKDGCITTFKSLLIESEVSKCFGKFKLNPCTYCSLLLYFLDCFVHNQCITFRLNKPKHSGDGAKRSPFLNTTIMHFCCFFLHAH